jgi:hypothetical protein
MLKIKLTISFLMGLFLITQAVFGQLIVRDTIQVSGAILSSDSLQSLPGVHIYTQHKTGTISNTNGFFSIMCNCLDTLTFSFVGYEPFRYVVPDTFKINNYIMGVVLHTDTIMLSEVIILPWMNKAQFRNAFINHTPDQQTQIATRNLKIMGLQARINPQVFQPDMMPDYQLSKLSQDVEYRGMISPNDQINIVGLATMLFFWAHQALTQEERQQKIDAELRYYLKSAAKKFALQITHK